MRQMGKAKIILAVAVCITVACALLLVSCSSQIVSEPFPADHLELTNSWNYTAVSPGPEIQLTIPEELGEDLYAIFTTYIPQNRNPEYIWYGRGGDYLRCDYDDIPMESADGVDTSTHMRFVGESSFTLTLPGSYHSITWDPGYKLYAREHANDDFVNARTLWEDDFFLSVQLMSGENIIGFLVLKTEYAVDTSTVYTQDQEVKVLVPIHISLRFVGGEVYPMISGKHQEIKQEYIEQQIANTIAAARKLQSD